MCAGSTGGLALDDPFNLLQVVISVESPAAPVATDAFQQAFALPPEQRCTGNDEAAADFYSFIFFSAFSFGHGVLVRYYTHNIYSKYSYDDNEKTLIVKLFFVVRLRAGVRKEASRPETARLAMRLRILRFPGDLQGGTFQYTSSDNVDFVIGNQLFYNGALDAYFGSSGGPLWWQLSGSPYIVGVNTFQTNNGLYNGGTMLTDDFFNRVIAWSNDPNVIIGTAGNDVLTGTSGSDKIQGLLGDDTILGGDGSDIIYGNQGADQIYGNLGQDTGFAGQGNDTVYGGQGNDVVYGNFDNDIVYGNFGNDFVFGGQGADRLFGGQGNDTINGNLGNDTLFGNLGADRFVFGQGAGADVVMDFSAAQGDRLDVQGQTHVTGTAADGWALITLSGGGTIEMFALTAPQISDSFFI